MTAIADAAASIALQVLDGASIADLKRLADRAADFPAIVARSVTHERDVERRESEWLARQRR